MSGEKATFSSRPFDKLNKKIERQAAAAAPPPVRKKKKEEYTDEELFSSEMKNVQEIAEFRVLVPAAHPRKTSAPCAPLDPDKEAMAILCEIAEGQRPIPLPDTQEYIEWVHPDCRDSIIPHLHEGRFSVQASLDLHGFTVREAEDELDLFLHECFQKGLGCVKVIHGRGLRSVKGARLKDTVVKRLTGRFRKHLIAFVTARQCDGGLGALYVLLRKK
jgi:DNA-nicking Smr family endonuclease